MIIKSEQQTIPEVKPLLRRVKRKKEPLSRREKKVLIGLFLLTVFLSLFFYFKSEFSVIKKKITSPIVISNVSEKEKFDPSPILAEIKNLTQNLRGTYGFYVYRFFDKNSYGLHQDEIFPAASLMKLPVMLLVYQEAEEGNLKLDDYRELVKVMGQRSDNAAYNQLVKDFGKEKIQALIDSLGMGKTVLAKDDTTPADIGLFFRKLYQSELVPAKGGSAPGGSQLNRDEILTFLTKTSFEDRIPAGVPAGVRVAHKIGTETGVFSDAGIVFSEDPFVLVIMSKNAKESEAVQVLPKITRAVWRFENSK